MLLATFPINSDKFLIFQIDDEPESLLLPMPGRRKSRRHSTIQGFGAPSVDKHMGDIDTNTNIMQ